MQRYFIELSYKGTVFHGWQRQQNAVTVQEEVEKALSTLLRNEISVTGAGRTDTGVHARNYIAHFDFGLKELLPEKKWVYKLNQVAHPDIVFHKIIPVKADAHARFDALSREYRYYISPLKDPFRKDLSCVYQGPLDFQAMKDAEKILFEYSDFKSFCKLHSDVITTNCKIYESRWDEIDGQFVYTIKADRFLRNMVRAIVGTMLEIGRGKISKEVFKEIIEKKDRAAAGASASAQGLCLIKIEYPNDIFQIT